VTINLLDYDLPQLTRYFVETLGEKPFRARQVMRWIHQAGEQDFAAMTDLARTLREKLAAGAVVMPPRILAEHRSADGTVKWLMDTGGANAVETVFIPEGDWQTHLHGAEEGAAPELAAEGLKEAAGGRCRRPLPGHAVCVHPGGLCPGLHLLRHGTAGLQPQSVGGRNRRPVVARPARPQGLNRGMPMACPSTASIRCGS
jgi:hypothetical protein